MSRSGTTRPRTGGRTSGIGSDRRSAALALNRYTQQLGLVAVIVVLGVAFTAVNSAFASPDNLIDLFRAVTLYFIVACASTLVLVGGGLDFSIGAVYALGAVVAGLLIIGGLPWPLAVLGGIGVGVLAGTINAAVSVYLHVPPLIAYRAISIRATRIPFAAAAARLPPIALMSYPKTVVSRTTWNRIPMPMA